MATMGDILFEWEKQEYALKARIVMLEERIKELEEENERLRSE